MKIPVNKMSNPVKTKLSQEKETLFLTLYGKALDYRSKKSILNDKTAHQIVQNLNIDFADYKILWNRIFAVRARQFDDWVKDFIRHNPTSVILHLGCGLDTRITRIDPPKTVSWFDLDYPEVIELRKQFYSESPTYTFIGKSVNENNWLNKIPQDKPALIIAEGLFSYLSKDEVCQLFNKITNHFSNGGKMIFNVINSTALQKASKDIKDTTDAIQKWAVNDLNEIEELNPVMELEETLPLFKSDYIKELPFQLKIMLRLANFKSKYRNMVRLVCYKF